MFTLGMCVYASLPVCHFASSPARASILLFPFSLHLWSESGCRVPRWPLPYKLFALHLCHLQASLAMPIFVNAQTNENTSSENWAKQYLHRCRPLINSYVLWANTKLSGYTGKYFIYNNYFVWVCFSRKNYRSNWFNSLNVWIRCLGECTYVLKHGCV